MSAVVDIYGSSVGGTTSVPPGFRKRGASLTIVRTASRPSSPPASASAGSCRYSGGSASIAIAVDVRRIADDEVVALLRQVREQVGADQVDAVGEPVVADVALRDRERVRRDVDRVDVGLGIRMREQDREAAGAGAQVERGSSPSRRGADVAAARPSGSSSAMNERGTMTRSST